MTRVQHITPVTKAPEMAQTSLELKLQTITNILDIIGGVAGDRQQLVDNVLSLISTINSSLSDISLVLRQLPYKT